MTATPGKRLAYATDLADSAENSKTPIALAHNAHTVFLEAVCGCAIQPVWQAEDPAAPCQPWIGVGTLASCLLEPQ